MAGQHWHAGTKVGASMGRINGDSFRDNFRLGFHLGGFVEIPLGATFGIQPEIVFDQTNARVTDDLNLLFQPKRDIELHYLSFPVLLQIKPVNGFTFHVGPQYSVLINNEETILNEAGRAFSRGNFAVVAGGQIELDIFRIYGRYNIGLSNVSDIRFTNRWKTQQIQFGIGLAL